MEIKTTITEKITACRLDGQLTCFNSPCVSLMYVMSDIIGKK